LIGNRHPKTILEIVFSDLTSDVPVTGVCAGFENQEWRYKALVDDFIRWAPDWILRKSELRDVDGSNMTDLLMKALSRIYTSKKYENRGEIGELLLHMILRRFMGSDQAINRLYFKDASNDTVKGFDSVHIVEATSPSGETELDLWLGESKYYKDSTAALRDVLTELEIHLSKDYLRGEFSAITDKLEPDWKHAEAVKKLIDSTTSLDKIFTRIVVPVFITFNSKTAAKYRVTDSDYKDELELFIRKKWKSFQGNIKLKNLPDTVRVHLIMLPMDTKAKLLKEFDSRLKLWQQLQSI
jgi:hypothetical protein